MYVREGEIGSSPREDECKHKNEKQRRASEDSASRGFGFALNIRESPALCAQKNI